MFRKFKALDKQVVVITGASSGIGRQTAIRAAKAGAKVVLVARNEDALRSAVEEIQATGGLATYAVADVANIEQLKLAADHAVDKFGRIDTWINNAGVGIYSKLLKTDIADDRRLFETNFWGIVNGSRVAVPHLQASGGGALINLGSEVSDVSSPLLGMYSTSKHAVMGFTDALREELISADTPISVTLIKPSGINTPFAHHAKNNFENDATLPSPVYDVDLVADQILHAARYGGREFYVGGGGRFLVLLAQHFPGIADWVMGKFMPSQEFVNRPADHSNEALHQTRGFHRSHGDVDRDRHVRTTSLYGVVSRNPWKTALILAAGVTAAIVISNESAERHLS